jgi:ribonuclease P protein component
MTISNKLKLTITSRSSISDLFEKSTPCLKKRGIKILKTPTDKQGKILLVVSAKSGNAVVRNLFKRRIKSIFRQHSLYLLPYDFVIIGYKMGVENSFSELENLLLSLRITLSS